MTKDFLDIIVKLENRLSCGMSIPHCFDLVVIYDDGSKSIPISIFRNMANTWSVKFKNCEVFICKSKKEAMEYVDSETRGLLG